MRIVSRGIVSWAVVLLASVAADAQVWEAPVREVARPDLPDIAIASYDMLGPIIYYNPALVMQVGPILSAFFRAHEHAHIAGRHLQRELFEANPYNRVWVRQSYEKEADCQAAQQLGKINPEYVARAAAFFATTQGPNRPDWLHPTGYERAEVIQRCGARALPALVLGAGVPTQTIHEACEHPAHPEGDYAPCSHPEHPMGDVYPCQHACYDFYGRLFACHSMGDVQPCTHAAHARGDRVYCSHVAHPGGHDRVIASP